MDKLTSEWCEKYAAAYAQMEAGRKHEAKLAAALRIAAR